MKLKQKWDYFLNKYDEAKAAFHHEDVDDETNANLALIDNMLSRTITSSNSQCDMTQNSDLDPANFTYFIKQMFWLKEMAKMQMLMSENSKLYTWYPEYETSKLNKEFFRMSQERWQIHARVGTLLMNVKKHIDVDFSRLEQNSDAYTLVIYKNGKETVASVGSQQSTGIVRVELEPGFYSIIHRYYCDSHELHCPSIVVDGEQKISHYQDPCKSEFISLMKFWMNHKINPVYLMQNLHTFYWLKHDKERVPTEVLNDFLPVANPDTQWSYGYLEKGQSVKLNVDPIYLNQYRIYLTFVNEMSLPVYGEHIKSEQFNSDPITQDGAFHIRLVFRGLVGESGMPPIEKGLEVSILN